MTLLSPRAGAYPVTIASVKLLGIVLALQVALGSTLVALVATDNLPFTGDDEADGSPPRAARRAGGPLRRRRRLRLLREQVELGPRPAGSPESRAARATARAHRARAAASRRCPAACATWSGRCRGREPGYVVVGAHYDTKDIPGFVGANDGASGTAVAAQLARTIRAARATRSQFIFFDGEESPRGAPRRAVRRRGPARQQGGRAAASRDARAMVLLDFVGDRRLRIPREGYSQPRPVAQAACGGAERAGAGACSRAGPERRSSTTTSRSSSRACPSIDLIDFSFPCWHRRCDDMSAVSERSLDAVGET